MGSAIIVVKDVKDVEESITVSAEFEPPLGEGASTDSAAQMLALVGVSAMLEAAARAAEGVDD